MGYSKGEWKAYCLGSEGYQVRRNNEGIPAAKVKEELKERLTPIVKEMGGSFETQRDNAQLIVSAVNACIKVNPDNPQAVAKDIKNMHGQLKTGAEVLTRVQDIVAEVAKTCSPEIAELMVTAQSYLSGVIAGNEIALSVAEGK